jgi:hypothetical protein
VIVGKKMASDAVIRRERLADLPDDPAARANAIHRSGLAAFCAAAGVVAIAVGGSAGRRPNGPSCCGTC